MKEGDHDELSQIFNESVFRYIPGTDWPVDIEEWVAKRLEQAGCYLKHIVMNVNRPVGYVQLCQSETNTTNDGLGIDLGFLIGTSHWGRGYATEIVSNLIDRLIEPNGWDQEVLALVHPDNRASVNVLDKCGFRFFEKRTKDNEPEMELYVYRTERLARKMNVTPNE